MKKFFYLIIAAVLLLNACKKDEESPAASGTITLSENVINAEPKGGVYEIKVTSDADWRVSGVCDWARPLSETGRSGETLKIEVDESNTKETLSTQFKVFSGSAVQTLTVTSTPVFILELLSDPEVAVKSSASSIFISFDTNITDLEAVFTDNGEEWVVFNKRYDEFGKTTFHYNILNNTTYKEKRTELVLRGQGKESEKIAITQDQLDTIVTNNNRLVHDLTAGKLDFKVRANVDFEIQNLPSWLRLESNTKNQNADDDGLTESNIRLAFDATSGSRVANINFVANNNILLQMSVKQQDPDAILFNITDKELRKQLLSKELITYTDESLTEVELLDKGKTVKDIKIESTDFFNLDLKIVDGLNNFPLLENLTLNKVDVQTLDLSNCKKLKKLTINKLRKLEKVILNGCPILNFEYGKQYEDYLMSTSLTISSDKLTSINLNFSNYYISTYEKCETLDVSDCPNLTDLKAKREYAGNVKLKKIIVSQAQKDAIDAGSLTVEKSDSTEYEVKQ